MEVDSIYGIHGISDDEDDEAVDYAPNQALPVANLDPKFDGVPQDGMEYLFTVRWFVCSYYSRFD